MTNVTQLLANESLESAGYVKSVLTASRPRIEADWILDKHSLIAAEVYSLVRKGNIRLDDISDAFQDGWIAVMESLTSVDFRYSNEQICSYIKTFIHNRLVNKWIREPLAKKRINKEAYLHSLCYPDSCEKEIVEKVSIERIVQKHPSLLGNTRQSRNQALKRLLNRRIY